MARRTTGFFIALVLLVAPAGFLRSEPPARTDPFGDPVPEGAIARLGGVPRFRTGWVRSLIYSPDGKTLLSADGNNVQFWEAGTGKQLRRWSADGEVTAAAWSADGKRLATAGPTSAIRDPETGKVLHKFEVHAGPIHAIAISPDGKTLALGQREGGTRLYDMDTAKALFHLELPGETQSCVAFSPDGKTVATGDQKTIHLWDAGTGKKLRELAGHTETINAVAFSADGKSLASGSYDQTVRLWDVTAGKERLLLKVNDGAVLAVAFSPDGKTLATGSWARGRVSLWDAETGKRSWDSDSGNHAFAVAFSPDGKTLAASDSDRVHLRDAATGQTIRTPHRDEITFQSAVFARDAKTVTTLSDDRTFRTWDAVSGKELSRSRSLDLPGFGNESRPLLSPDGQTLAWLSWEKSVQIWDVANRRRIHWFREDKPGKGNEGGEDRVAFAPDGKTVAIAGDDRTIRIRDMASGKSLLSLTGHEDGINSLAYAPDGKILASGSRDKSVRLWDTGTGKQVRKLSVAEAVVLVSYSPDGKTVAIVGSAGVDVCDAATGDQRYQVKQKAVHVAAFSPDGKLLATDVSEPDNSGIDLWDAATGKHLRRLKDSRFHYDPVFSPDSKMVAGASEKQVTLWNAATGEMILLCAGTDESLRSIQFSPDGKQIVGCDAKNVIWSWDSATGGLGRKAESARREGYSDAVFSPDLRFLSLSGQDHTIRLCRVPTGEPLVKLEGHDGAINSIAISPDGKLLASGGDDRAIRLWDLATGKEVRRLEGHANGVMAVSFSGDGTTLASGSWDQTACIWDVKTGKEVRAIKHTCQVDRVALSPDARLFAYKASSTALCLWDLKSGEPLPGIQDKQVWEGTRHMVFSPDGRTLALVRDGGAVQMWEIATGQLRRQIDTDGGFSLVFSTDGNVLASLESTVMLWDLTGKTSTAARLTEKELDRLWEDLAGEDAVRAYQAVGRLVADPAAAVPGLGAKIAAERVDDRRIARLIADLDSDSFDVREKAMTELERQGSRIEFALKQAVENKPPLEVQRRLESLLEKATKSKLGLPTEQIRMVRAIEVLERAGGKEAQTVLETLAKQTPWPRLAQDAKAAAERLTKRP